VGVRWVTVKIVEIKHLFGFLKAHGAEFIVETALFRTKVRYPQTR
jgi:hypothetical protein